MVILVIIAIVGPTGVGKTKLSIELAHAYNAIIINFDATQIYKELNIGSSKITCEEKEGIIHYLLDVKNPNEDYSVKDYQEDARKIISENKDKNIILVGGTGLYLSALLMDYHFYDLENNNNYDDYSTAKLYELALVKDKNLDIDSNNRIRLISFLNRGYEVKEKPKMLYDAYIIGLTTERKKLYENINSRVDNMIKNGLIDEVKMLHQKYPNSKILSRAIGYKELIEYLDGNTSLYDAINKIKLNSRHYAKRQYTWFKNKMNVTLFNVNYNDFNQTIFKIKSYLKEKESK